MARAEEMDGFRRVQALLRGNDDADEIPESVCLQERHDSSDRAYRDVEGGHRSRAALAQVRMEAALDRAHEGHVATEGDRLLSAANRLVDVLRGARRIVVRLGEHIEHRPEVGADGLLESDDLRVRHIDVAVDVGLERPGIRHDGPWESQERVDAVAHDRIPSGRFPEDVRVRDQDLCAKSRGQVPGRNDWPVWVDDRGEGRRRDPTVPGLQQPDPGEAVALPDLEHARPSEPGE